jgi:hypothetical protein
VIVETKALLEAIPLTGHRDTLGDVEALRRSIKQHGLIDMPVLTEDGRVVAGQRCIAALRGGFMDKYVRVSIVHTIEEAEQLLTARSDVEAVAMSVKEKMRLGETLEHLHLLTEVERRTEAARQGSRRRHGLQLDGDQVKREAPSTIIGRCLGMSNATYSRVRAVWRTATVADGATPPEVRAEARRVMDQINCGALPIATGWDIVREMRANGGLTVRSVAGSEDPAMADGEPEPLPELPPMHHRRRSRLINDQRVRLDRLADQAIGLRLGAETIIGNEMPIRFCELERAKVAQLTRDLRNAKAGITRLMKLLQEGTS